MFKYSGISLSKLDAPATFLVIFYIAFIIGVIIYYFYKRKQYKEVINLTSKSRLKPLSRGAFFRFIEKPSFSLLSLRVADVKEDYIFQGEYNGNNVCLFYLSMVNGQFKRLIQTAVYIQSKKTHFPNFMLKPMDIKNNMEKIFEGKDILFPDNTRFTKDYILKGNNEDQVRNLFKPHVINFFERNQDVVIETNGKGIIICFADNLVEPSNYQMFIEKILGILRLFE
jgi:hypothetical protein